eukprot:1445626-Rhodomonas_salina.3
MWTSGLYLDAGTLSRDAVALGSDQSRDLRVKALCPDNGVCVLLILCTASMLLQLYTVTGPA